ncbi:hypothetical protein Ppb6_01176 [Photorhabdus australis subsp. thailandensis]|uniref:Uncharacterized protein n=1 Tax=Photorhabdus australis subsp. thailandensis TaxID=2805096 RepID=A0A1C0U6I0_9GAMM|nr:hypothetical protein [Photorhabdus australis]OCQ53550.1 hypothetical protein Ppb6_01176 [Photorhabdus australis subsp. thailandensis]
MKIAQENEIQELKNEVKKLRKQLIIMQSMMSCDTRAFNSYRKNALSNAAIEKNSNVILYNSDMHVSVNLGQ